MQVQVMCSESRRFHRVDLFPPSGSVNLARSDAVMITDHCCARRWQRRLESRPDPGAALLLVHRSTTAKCQMCGDRRNEQSRHQEHP
jgi:hypothetical protein